MTKRALRCVQGAILGASVLAAIGIGGWLLYRPARPPSEPVVLNTEIVDLHFFELNGQETGSGPIKVTAGGKCRLTGQFKADIDFWGYRIPGTPPPKRPKDDLLARPFLILWMSVVRDAFNSQGYEEVVKTIVPIKWHLDGTVDCQHEFTCPTWPGVYELRLCIHQRPQGYPGERYPKHDIASVTLEVAAPSPPKD